MNKEQVIRILKVVFIATLFMLISEIIFSIEPVLNWFESFITPNNMLITYIAIWIIMFLQVTVLNIPAYVILLACSRVGINTLGITYILVVMSAYMSGCMLAYLVGRIWGSKAVKWCAGSQEDYDKWSNILNSKGRIWYFVSVLLPIFPDDLLCIVAGGVKFNFLIFVISNLIGRTIGLYTMLVVLKLLGSFGGGFPYMIIVWCVAMIGEIVAIEILKKKKVNENVDDNNNNDISDIE